MFLKPQDGRTVYFEGTRIKLPDDGAEVTEPLTTYWHRRINDGDVIEGTPEKAEATTEAAGAAPVVAASEHPQEG